LTPGQRVPSGRGSQNRGCSSEEAERRQTRDAGAVLVRNNHQPEMGNSGEIKALFFALIREGIRTLDLKLGKQGHER
jgi:hypothetical protein